MKVGSVKVEFLVPGASSLKEKRRVLKSLKDRVRNKFNVSVAEVDYQDLWQRAAIGVAVVGTDGPFVMKVLEGILKYFRRDFSIQVLRHETEAF